MEVSSPKIAEMEKLLENIYRHINIGLANEMAIICEKMGIDVWEVIEAAKTKPYGFQAFYPGPGLGGHCIPLDPYYLVWKAREYDYHAKLIETSGIINDYMPEYIVERITAILNTKKKSLNGANVLLIGVAYKEDIDDYRESPALKIMNLLRNKGSNVKYFDPHIKEVIYNGIKYKSIEMLTEQFLKSIDIAVITTGHRMIDYSYLQKHTDIIFDTKNITKHLADRENIVRL